MRIVRCWCVVFALVVAIGPAATVQGFAWLGMLTTRMTSQSVTEAVQSTFDGSAPCALCCAASGLLEAENGKDGKGNPAPERTLKVMKIEMMVPVSDWQVSIPDYRVAKSWPTLKAFVALRGIEQAPELPPPRA